MTWDWTLTWVLNGSATALVADWSICGAAPWVSPGLIDQ